MGGQPDFATVVLQSDGFSQLLDTLTFVRRVQQADTNCSTSSAPREPTPTASRRS